MTGVLVRRVNLDTERERHTHTQGEGHMRTEDGSDASTSQGMPKMTRKPRGARTRQGRIPLQVSETAWPCCRLDLGPLASSTVENTFLLFLATQFVEFCYAQPRKLTQVVSPVSPALL